MVRQWADKELAPHVAEDGEGRDPAVRHHAQLLRKTFGMDEMVRAPFAKLEEAAKEAPRGQWRARARCAGDPAMMAVVADGAVARLPGLLLAFGASLGLAGGAIMAKGTLAAEAAMGAADSHDARRSARGA